MIHFSHVNKNYGSVVALKDVTFDAQVGVVTALVGHNGAGKTTSLRMMIGLITPDSGTVEINGLTPNRHGVKVRQQVCYVPDVPFVSPHLTGEEHLQFQADVYKQAKAMERARELAERYRLSVALKRSVGTYSRGMTQRLALIRALMIDSSILLLDEPFNALDPVGIHTLIADLKKRAANGGTILVSSHLLAMLEELAQEVIVLKQGQVVHTGSLAGIDWDAHMHEWFDDDEGNEGDFEEEDEIDNEEAEIIK